MEQKEKTQDGFYKELVNNATPEDVEVIDEKLDGMNKGPITALWEDIQVLYQLVKDPQRAWGSKVAIIAALLYLISPIDAIPDVIPVIGLLDDAAVIGLVIKQFSADIAEYKRTHNL